MDKPPKVALHPNLSSDEDVRVELTSGRDYDGNITDDDWRSDALTTSLGQLWIWVTSLGRRFSCSHRTCIRYCDHTRGARFLNRLPGGNDISVAVSASLHLCVPLYHTLRRPVWLVRGEMLPAVSLVTIFRLL